MHFSIHQGMLTSVRYAASPHYDARPVGTEIDLLVIHSISLPPGDHETQYIEDFFCGEGLDPALHPYFATLQAVRVSAHLLIARGGEVIQFVPFTQRAWHAGESFFDGRTRCNDFSIGIELVGTDDTEYTDQQYARLVEVIFALQAVYPKITHDRIVGHSEIAPGRKTDPGKKFDWQRLKQLLEVTQGTVP
ncbi:MAG: 1,6-anhydro-N-acetylmuramyl-L-alanine amidase AmpD [Gammaproteobacteria bacterium]|nr:1,6-anhydro-N-acetylmuramyl-L-alanine amidase AmpD [Gammaproteobacteria bacterium]